MGGRLPRPPPPGAPGLPSRDGSNGVTISEEPSPAPGRQWGFGASRRSRETSAPLHASATRWSSPKFDVVAIGHDHLLAVTILISPDRSTIRLPLTSLPSTT